MIWKVLYYLNNTKYENSQLKSGNMTEIFIQVKFLLFISEQMHGVI